MRASNTSALSRTAPTIIVAILHVIAIYAISMSLGIVPVPKLPGPIEIVDVPEPPRHVDEPTPPKDPNIVSTPVDFRLTIPPLEFPRDTSGDIVAKVIEVPPPVIEEVRRIENPPPRALHAIERIDPGYPGTDRRLGHEGTVQLRVHVDERGHVLEVELARSSGYAGLDASAVNAVRRWRFSPATDGTRTISDWGTVAVTFRLE